MANCETCPSKGSCSTDKEEKCGVQNNPLNKINKIIGVMSGKGGVGKSTVSTMLAHTLIKQGHKVGILDADITGPSIPRLLGIHDKKATMTEQGIIPYYMENGLKVISLNLLIEDENRPVIWRGPMISGMVKQFYTDVIWEELDYLIIDMPPGTGDVALTVMQMIPVTGIVMVSVPQDMVSMIVSKAISMTRQMDIPVLGVVENMSYIQCPDCNTKIEFYEGKDTQEFLKSMEVDLLGEIPMCKDMTNISSKGLDYVTDDIQSLFNGITDRVLKNI